MKTRLSSLRLLTAGALTLSTLGCGGGGDDPPPAEPPAVQHNELALDGVDDFAREGEFASPSALDLSTFTVEALVFPGATKSMPIVSDSAYGVNIVRNPGAANGGLGVQFARFLGDGATVSSSTTFRDIKANQWNHVAASYDAATNTCRIAINGNVSSEEKCISGPLALAYDGRFGIGTFDAGNASGTRAPALTNTFAGRIDEVRLSNTVRYTANFTPQAALETDAATVAHWRMNEPLGSTTLQDASPTGRALRGGNGAAVAAGTR